MVQNQRLGFRGNEKWLFTGTPEFFESRQGVAGLAPLHDRIRFLKQGRFASLRQPQLELVPFDAARLQGVAVKLRELYPSADRGRLDQQVSTGFIQQLVAEVTAGFKGDVGVVPRQFLREFVNVMDLVEQEPEYSTDEAYEFHVPASDSLRPEEQHAISGAALAAMDDEDDGGLVPQEDIW